MLLVDRVPFAIQTPSTPEQAEASLTNGRTLGLPRSRGRIGGLVDPSLLIYATGGLAVGHFKGTSAASLTATTYRGTEGITTNPVLGPIAVAGVGFSESTDRRWTIGAGLEEEFTPNWSAKVEYLYLDDGTHSFGPVGVAKLSCATTSRASASDDQFR